MALIQVKNKSARLITVRGKKIVPGGLPVVFDTDKEIGVEKDCEGVTGLIVTPLKAEPALNSAPGKAETAKEKKAREASEKAAALLAASQSQNEPPKDEELSGDENEDEEKKENGEPSEDKPEGWK